FDWEPTRRIGRRLPKIGWHKTDDGRELDFLLRSPRALLPSSARAPVPAGLELDEPEIVYELDSQTPNSERPNGLLLKGSADGWRHHAERHARDSNVVFGVGVVLAALLLKFCGEPARIYNNCGVQKIGKSTLLQIIQAVVGKPYRLGAGDNTFGFGLNATA